MTDLLLPVLLVLALIGGVAEVQNRKTEIQKPCVDPDMQAIEAKARQYGQMNELAYVVDTCEQNHKDDHPAFEECQKAHADLCDSMRIVDEERIPGFAVISDDDLPELRKLCSLDQQEQ